MQQSLQLGIYQHFKNKKFYRVHGISKHSETLEDFVMYEPLYEGSPAKMWIRPVAMFLEEVEWEGKKVPRFLFKGENVPSLNFD